MSFGDTLCDVVGSDVLADNYIAADFPDDDDRFFDANEFINLNQGPDPDTSLNFQDRKA